MAHRYQSNFDKSRSKMKNPLFDDDARDKVFKMMTLKPARNKEFRNGKAPGNKGRVASIEKGTVPQISSRKKNKAKRLKSLNTHYETCKCGKICFDSRGDTSKYISQMRSKGKPSKGPIAVYRCEFNKYHFGHTKRTNN